MAQHSALPDTPDAQFEWFHSLAQSLEEFGAVAVNEGTRSGMLRFTTEHLPGHEFSHEQDAHSFLEDVQRLRGNERAWNKALQAAIISACDRAAAGEQQGAKGDLEHFASSCPWALFARVARDQASQLVAR